MRNEESAANKVSETQLVALAMREWTRRFIESPDQFETDFQAIRQHLRGENPKTEPSYDQIRAAYLGQIADEIRTRH